MQEERFRAELERIDAAFTRLDNLLSSVVTISEKYVECNRSVALQKKAVYRVNEDRSRLANQLECEQVRANCLKETNRAVAKRLLRAMESIRAILGG